jgi:ABC-type multidrug transport system ATPase subunit
MSENIITVQNITSAYGRKMVLRGVTFTADRGQCIGIVGANGCGKSTLLSIMAGTLKPKSGTVQYNGQYAWYDGGSQQSSDSGQDVRDAGSALQITRRSVHCGRNVIRKMTGYVPQENPLIPELTVYDNLRLWYPDKEQLKEELSQGFLGILGIDKYLTKTVNKLSGGMKKRVSIGIAMAGMPPVLLMDEPSASLDLVCKEDIRKYLKAYLQRKGTVVLTTHEENELDLCDKLYVLRGGRLCEIDRTLRGEELVRTFA